MSSTVFTNGCFDILHAGHVDLLARARALGDKLIVGINSDGSIRKIKGDGRPFVDQNSRREVLLALRSVDDVLIFDEPTPERIIREVRPDILVKGGDWPETEIIGAEFVRSYGGDVRSLPLMGNYSTTRIVEAVRDAGNSVPLTGDLIEVSSLDEHLEVFRKFSEQCGPAIAECQTLIIDTFRSGNKLLICGNGGSAADAQHLAAEFSGRYEIERRALPAIALTTDTSALTAIGNDYGFERVFARQVEALAVSGDLLIAISTSGNSPNVLAAVMSARSAGCRVIGLTGISGKKLAGLSDSCVLVPSSRTARIQECHIATAHIWCEAVDQAFSGGGDE